MVSNEREVNSLGNFFHLAKIQQDQFEFYMQRNLTAAAKNQRIISIISTLVEELLSCIQYKDARQILEASFDTVYSRKIKILETMEQPHQQQNPERQQNAYFEANVVQEVLRREPTRTEQQQLPMTSLIGQKRNAAEPSEESSLIRNAPNLDLWLSELPAQRDRDVNNFLLDPIEEKKVSIEETIMKQLKENKLDQLYKVATNHISLSPTLDAMTLSFNKEKKILYAIGGQKVCALLQSNIKSMLKFTLGDINVQKQYASSICLDNKHIIVSCYNEAVVYAYSLEHLQSSFREIFSTFEDVISLAPYGNSGFLAGQLEGYLQLFDFTKNKTGVSVHLQNQAQINQINRTLRSENEFALATSQGLQFAQYMQQINRLSEVIIEVHLKDTFLTSVFEFDLDQYVINAINIECCLFVYNRVKKMTTKRIMNPNQSSLWLQLQPVSQFNKDSFPFILLRELFLFFIEKSSLYIANIKTGSIYSLLSGLSCYFIHFNKDFLINSVNEQKDLMSIFLLTEGADQIHIEEFTYHGSFMKALKMLAKEAP